MKRARVTTTTKGETYDPQGEAITKAIKQIGVDYIDDVKVGRHFYLHIDENAPEEEVKENIKRAAEELLHNNIIEDYQITYDC